MKSNKLGCIFYVIFLCGISICARKLNDNYCILVFLSIVTIINSFCILTQNPMQKVCECKGYRRPMNTTPT